MTPEVAVITSVDPADPGSSELAGSNIDAPRPGDPLGAYGVTIRGWAAGRLLRAVEIQVRGAGRPIAVAQTGSSRPDVAAALPGSVDAESSGFEVVVNTLLLDEEFELAIEAVLEDGSRAAVATIHGHRQQLRPSFEPSLQPLVITTTGRTGSTLLVQMLQGHPGIVAYRPFQFEARVATYWIGVLKELSDPASYLRQLSDARNLDQPAWWLGRGLPPPRTLPDAKIQDWIGGDALIGLAAFCQDRIDALYRRIAQEQGRGEAVRFAEKYIPSSVQSIVWELYEDAREVFLVRDFRDVLASMLAFNEKRGIQGFQRGRTKNDEDYVRDIVGKSISALLEDWHARCQRAHIVRYEDLVKQPIETLTALLRYLGLESNPATVRAMAARASQPMPEMQWHRTTESPLASIGRWRQDLSPRLRHLAEVTFGQALEAFGYHAGGDSQKPEISGAGSEGLDDHHERPPSPRVGRRPQ